MCFSIQSASALGPAGNEYPANSIDAQEAAASLAELPTPADSADLADNAPEIQSGSRRPAGKNSIFDDAAEQLQQDNSGANSVKITSNSK
jgi:hypothetical protein